MNEIMKSEGPTITMTSLELVEFINSHRKEQAEAAGVLFPSKGFAKLEHSDFMKKVLEVLGGGSGNFSSTYIHPQNGQIYPCYTFPKREASLLAMSYSYELQAKVFDRMTALEAQPVLSPANFSRMQLIELAMQAEQERIESEQKRLVLEGVVAAQAPKVEALDRIASSDGSMCITDAAKTLQIQPRKLTQLLQEKGWVYRRPMGSGWLAYQDRIQQGLMEHKVTTGEKGDGHEWTNTQARITPKGLTKLADVIRQAGAH